MKCFHDQLDDYNEWQHKDITLSPYFGRLNNMLKYE